MCDPHEADYFASHLPTAKAAVLRINSPHGAGSFGGSALHPINRMSIFLADTNKNQ